MFSFGIVMWELVTGEEPYADLHYGAIIGIYIHIYPSNLLLFSHCIILYLTYIFNK